MLKKLTAMILKGEAGTQTIVGWIAGFAGVVILRTFIEQFSNPPYFGVAALDAQTLIGYSLFYLLTIFCIATTVSIITKQRDSKVINLALLGFPVILLAPSLDILISAGRGYTMAYLFDSHAKLLLDFLTFFGPFKSPGITIGLRIELFIILCGVGWYVWTKTKKTTATFGAVVTTYAILFVMLALPGVIYTIVDVTQNLGETTFSFLRESITGSNIPANTLNAAFSYSSYARMLEFGFVSLISQILFILFFIIGVVWSWYTHKNLLKKILGNARVERVLFYTSLITLGALYSYTINPVALTWTEWLGFIVLVLSWFSAWMYAVHTNDLTDIDTDTVSNPERPLPKNALTPQVMRDIGFGWLVLSLVGAYIVGYYPFFMSIVFTSAYYVYSAPPLRLKRVPMLSSFLISLACLATILAGFFFLSPNKMLATFPTLYAVGIVVVLTLGVNIRDIKDIEGDRKAGIRTVPVIFGAYGRQVVGILLSLSFLLLPIFLSFYTLYLFAIPAAVIGYKLCVRQPYNEKYIFILFFTFCASSILLTSFLLSLLK
ncbi:MAG: UbiA family prenyltransferase [Patescibacteria group bacterium]